MSESVKNKLSSLVLSKLREFFGPDVSEAIVLRIKEKYDINISSDKAIISNPELLERAFRDLLGAVAASLLGQINHDLINYSSSNEHSSDSLQHIADKKFRNYIKMMGETASAVDQETITESESKNRKSVKPAEIFTACIKSAGTIESLPISQDEEYKFDYNSERGVILEFLR